MSRARFRPTIRPKPAQLSIMRFSRPATNDEIKKALGVSPTKHWPDDKILRGPMPWTQGLVQVVVAPKGYTFNIGGEMQPSTSRMARRCFTICPQCDAHVCAGHLGQHMGRKDHQV